MQLMNNKIITTAAVAVVLLIFIGAIWNYQQSSSGFSVVYMATGEVYIGELSTFPRLSLVNGYQYQTVNDPKTEGKTSLQLAPLSDAVWAPRKLYLNRDQVVFYGPIAETSQVFKAIKDKQSAK